MGGEEEWVRRDRPITLAIEARTSAVGILAESWREADPCVFDYSAAVESMDLACWVAADGKKWGGGA